MMPLYGFMRGDTLGLVILVSESDTVAEIGRNLAQAVSVRVGATKRLVVSSAGNDLDPASTVRQAGLSPLDRIDVREEGAP